MILVTGSKGFLGKRLVKFLKEKNFSYLETSYSLGLDLRDYDKTMKFFEQSKPMYLLNCAAYVGGIQFGIKHSAELYDNNLRIITNLLKACKESGVKRIVNPISNCSYPADAFIFKEDEYWNGPLHESVMVYGMVRKMLWVGAWAYNKQYNLDSINLIMPNIYGPDDHFDEERSHALGALVMKIVNAKVKNLPEVIVWGTGNPVREWLYVDDAANAMVRALDVCKYDQPINIGVNKGISISFLVEIIKEIINYKGKIFFDTSKPDGAPCKIMNCDRSKEILGWSPEKDFRLGIKETVEWYIKHSGLTNGL